MHVSIENETGPTKIPRGTNKKAENANKQTQESNDEQTDTIIHQNQLNEDDKKIFYFKTDTLDLRDLKALCGSNENINSINIALIQYCSCN